MLVMRVNDLEECCWRLDHKPSSNYINRNVLMVSGFLGSEGIELPMMMEQMVGVDCGLMLVNSFAFGLRFIGYRLRFKAFELFILIF